MESSSRQSRRGFLRQCAALAGGVGVAGLLAACGAGATAPSSSGSTGSPAGASGAATSGSKPAASAAPAATSGTGASAAGSPAASTGPIGKPGAKPEKPSIKLGLPVEATSFMPIFVGIQETYKQQGLDVQVVSFRGDSEVAQALAGGSTDVNVASLNGLLNMLKAGQPVIGFYAGFDQSDFAWLGNKDVKTWADLKGKSMGISTYGSLTDALSRFALQKHGLVPEKDVHMVQAGGTPSAYQALKAGRLGGAIISPPFKWEGPDEGLHLLGNETDEVAPKYPKHVFIAKTAFLNGSPNTVTALLRGHVAAIRWAKANKDATIKILQARLKFPSKYGSRAYDEVMPDFNERGTLPESAMPVFWKLAEATGDVKQPLPESQFLDRRYIDSFDKWAPASA